jgi:hypothetical protein
MEKGENVRDDGSKTWLQMVFSKIKTRSWSGKKRKTQEAVQDPIDSGIVSDQKGPRPSEDLEPASG